MSQKLEITRIFAVILGGVLLYFYSIKCGLLFTDDSYNYIHAAISFQRGMGLLSNDGTPASSWPPVFAIIISMLPKTARGLELFYLFLFIVNAILLARAFQMVFKTSWQLLGLAGCLFAVNYQMLYVFIWSEALFIVILVPSLLLFHFWVKKSDLKNFLVLIASLNLLCLTRNAGIFIVIGLTIILIYRQEMNWKRMMGFFLLSTLGFFIWNIFATYFFSDGFDFTSMKFFSGVGINIINALDHISAWFIPRTVSIVPRIVILLAVTTVFFRSTHSHIGTLKKQILLLVPLVYIAGILILGELEYYEMDRYFAPVYPLLVAYLFLQLEKMTLSRKFRLILVALGILWCGYLILRTYSNSETWRERSCRIDQQEIIDSIRSGSFNDPDN